MRHLRIVTSQRPYGGNIIAKMADCGSDVEFKNDKHCAYDENNWRLTLTTISLCRFGTLRPSHFATRTPTDFLAKARLLDRDVNSICR